MKNRVLVQEYVYDFAVDGGAQGTIVLSDKNGKAPLPVGAIVKDVTARVVTQCTSGGSATVAWGNGDDTDGYTTHGSPIAVASLTANAMFNAAGLDSALLWDGTNDHMIPLYIDDATTGNFSFVIGTADLTAGKIVFIVEYLYPAIDV